MATARDLQAHGWMIDDQVDQRGVMPDGWRIDVAQNWSHRAEMYLERRASLQEVRDVGGEMYM